MKSTTIFIISLAFGIASCSDQGTNLPAPQVTPVVETQITWQHTNMSAYWPVQAILAIDSTNVLCGTYASSVNRSTDNGMNWAQSCTGMITNEDILCLAVTDEGPLFAGSGGVGSYRSTDLGATWTHLSGSGGIVWNLFPCSRGEVLGGVFYGGVFRTTDYGAKWAVHKSGLDDRVESVAKTPTGRLLAGTVTGLFTSADSGASWIRDTLGIPSLSVYSLTIASNGYIFAGCETGVYRSTDDGVTWTTTNVPSAFSAFCLALGRNDWIFAGMFGDGVFLSKDYGHSWVHISTGLSDNGVIRSLAVSPEGYLFAGTYKAGIFRTTGPVYP